MAGISIARTPIPQHNERAPAPPPCVMKVSAGRTLAVTHSRRNVHGARATAHTSIVAFAPVTRADLKRGRILFAIAQKEANGNCAARGDDDANGRCQSDDVTAADSQQRCLGVSRS
jgi:hypothetical protein